MTKRVSDASAFVKHTADAMHKNRRLGSRMKRPKDPLYAVLFHDDPGKRLDVKNKATLELELHHSPDYSCRLRDMAPAHTIVEAYEAGFRGRKQVYAKFKKLHNEHNRGRAMMIPERINKLLCDSCGTEIVSGLQSNLFYFCRMCKGKGNRQELCFNCYNHELHQHEGKHYDEDLGSTHAHFMECRHVEDMEAYKSIDAAYNQGGTFGRGVKTTQKRVIKRIFCDSCHVLILSSADVGVLYYACNNCRDTHKRRFELCSSCWDKFRRGDHLAE